MMRSLNKLIGTIKAPDNSMTWELMLHLCAVKEVHQAQLIAVAVRVESHVAHVHRELASSRRVTAVGDWVLQQLSEQYGVSQCFWIELDIRDIIGVRVFRFFNLLGRFTTRLGHAESAHNTLIILVTSTSGVGIKDCSRWRLLILEHGSGIICPFPFRHEVIITGRTLFKAVRLRADAVAISRVGLVVATPSSAASNAATVASARVETFITVIPPAIAAA
jgi:hypothetical protein